MNNRILLSPEELDALAAHHEGCTLDVIRVDDTLTTATAFGGEPPFMLDLRRDTTSGEISVGKTIEGGTNSR